MRGWHSLTEKNRYFDKVEIKILNLILLLRQQKGFRRIFMDTKEKLWSWREKFGSQHFKLSCSESVWKVNIAICDWRQTQAGGKNSWECESVLHFLSLLSHCPFIHFISFLSLSLCCNLLSFLSLSISLFSISCSLSSFISCSVPFHSHPLFHHLFQPLMKEVEIDGRGGGLVVNILAFYSFCIPLSVLLSYSIFLTFSLIFFLTDLTSFYLFCSLSVSSFLSANKSSFLAQIRKKQHSQGFLFLLTLKNVHSSQLFKSL